MCLFIESDYSQISISEQLGIATDGRALSPSIPDPVENNEQMEQKALHLGFGCKILQQKSGLLLSKVPC